MSGIEVKCEVEQGVIDVNSVILSECTEDLIVIVIDTKSKYPENAGDGCHLEFNNDVFKCSVHLWADEDTLYKKEGYEDNQFTTISFNITGIDPAKNWSIISDQSGRYSLRVVIYAVTEREENPVLYES